MKATDLMITRAGASTMSEIIATELPAIFVPSPFVTNNHQYKNAKLLADEGAALIIKEENFDGHNVSDAVCRLLEDTSLRQKMSKSIGKFYDLETSQKIFSEIKRLVVKSQKKQ